MSRIAVGIFPLQRATISLKSLLISSEESVARLIKNHRIEIKDNTANLNLSVDVALLQRAFANIFVNAADNSPPNNPTEAFIDQNTKSAIITITDHGAGLPEEELVEYSRNFIK